MEKDHLVDALARAEKMAATGKLNRLLPQPLRYLRAMTFLYLLYPLFRKSRQAIAPTFYGHSLNILLPAGMDLHLLGIKSHPSEIRLAKYLIRTLEQGMRIVDVGAHFGYYTGLTSQLVGQGGEVCAFEASTLTVAQLRTTFASVANVRIYHNAASDFNGPLSFYEYPPLYSEYNTIHPDQFVAESWHSGNRPMKTTVQALTLDSVFDQQPIDMVKIDTEGGELQVIRGMKQLLIRQKPVVVMEYLTATRVSEQYDAALRLLIEFGYGIQLLDQQGIPRDVSDIDQLKQRLNAQKTQSENVVMTALS